MQIEKSGCSSMTTSNQKEKSPASISEINPFVHTCRLIFNEKYTELYEKYVEGLNMDIPESEMVEKYIKLPYSLNCRSMFSYTQDVENKGWVLVEFQEIEHLLEISYVDLTQAIFKAYGINVEVHEA